MEAVANPAVTPTASLKAVRVVATAANRPAVVVAWTRLTLAVTEPTVRETASLLETKEVEEVAAAVNLAAAVKMTRATVASKAARAATPTEAVTKEETPAAAEIRVVIPTEAARVKARVVTRTAAATMTAATTTKLWKVLKYTTMCSSELYEMKIVNPPFISTALVDLLALVLYEHEPIWSQIHEPFLSRHYPIHSICLV
jgi:DNA-binding LytR/AlgR family response regulator